MRTVEEARRDVRGEKTWFSEGKKKSFEAYNNNLYAGHISRKAAVNYGSRGRRK